MGFRSRRWFRLVTAALLSSGIALASGARSPLEAGAPDHNFQDFIAPPGEKLSRPAMLHADLIEGYDRRLPLDTVVVALDNGSRACRVLGADSLWAVDYTWVYPHTVFPPRWYDADDLLRVGDSLGLGDDTRLDFTFGTYRLGVKAGSYEQLRAEANRLRPAEISKRLAGRLKLKLERAEEARKRAAGAPDSAATTR